MMRRVTINDVGVLSGEELIRAFGPPVAQQLVDLMVAAVRRGDEHEIAAIDRRSQEVRAALNGNMANWYNGLTASPGR